MFDLPLERTISTIVETMLPIGSKESLYVRVRVSLTNLSFTVKKPGPGFSLRKANSEDDPIELHGYAHFLFNRYTNYTKVWCAVSRPENKVRFDRPKPDQWAMTSYHDSAWRSDGFRAFQEMAYTMGHLMANPQLTEHPVFIHEGEIEAIERVLVTDVNSNDPNKPHHRIVTSITDVPKETP